MREVWDLDDLELQKVVADWLSRDPRLAPYGLKARVNQGFVTLQGVVDVLAEKEYAEEQLRSMADVRGVENSLVICTDGGIDDEDVAFEVSEELWADPSVPDTIGVDVRSGRVRLLGQADTLAQEFAAKKAAMKARGVTEVTSEIRLDCEQVDDATLTNRVKDALMQDGRIYFQTVGITCHDGVVYLSGKVENDEQRLVINHLVYQIPGVLEVKSNLQVAENNPDEVVH